jgi:FtsZ-binding cell division protein ZapB
MSSNSASREDSRRIHVLVAAASAAFLIMVIGSVRPAGADDTPGGLIGGFLPPTSSDTLVSLVPSREEDPIKADIDSQKQALATADHLARRSSTLMIEAKARVEVLKAEIDELKSKEKQAKQENRDADRDDLSARRKSKELSLDLADAYLDLHGAEKELALAQRNLAETRVRLHEKELDLLSKRNALARARAGEGGTEDLRNALDGERELEGVVLSLVKDFAGKETAVAKSQSDLVDDLGKIVKIRGEIAKSSRK